MGVDLIQNCEVTGFELDAGRVVAVQTKRGRIAAGKVALAAAGHSSVLAGMVGLALPLQSHPLQALVSELLEPVHPTVVMSNAQCRGCVYAEDDADRLLTVGIDSRRSA